jgi:hypothetical protein
VFQHARITLFAGLGQPGGLLLSFDLSLQGTAVGAGGLGLFCRTLTLEHEHQLVVVDLHAAAPKEFTDEQVERLTSASPAPFGQPSAVYLRCAPVL